MSTEMKRRRQHLIFSILSSSAKVIIFSWSNLTEHKIYPAIVGILTFISRSNTTSESLKAKSIFIFQHCSSYEQLKFNAQLRIVEHEKFYNLRPWQPLCFTLEQHHFDPREKPPKDHLC